MAFAKSPAQMNLVPDHPIKSWQTDYLITVSLASHDGSELVISHIDGRLKTWVSEVLNVGALP